MCVQANFEKPTPFKGGSSHDGIMEKSVKDDLLNRIAAGEITFNYPKCVELQLDIVRMLNENKTTPEETMMILESIRMFIYNTVFERAMEKKFGGIKTK